MENQLESVCRRQAMRLKEIGFDYKCLNFYTTINDMYYEVILDGHHKIEISDHNLPTWKNRISAPSIQLAFQWIRNNHGIFPVISNTKEGFVFRISSTKNMDINDIRIIHEMCLDKGKYKSYESAEYSSLNVLLDIIFNSKKHEKIYYGITICETPLQIANFVFGDEFDIIDKERETRRNRIIKWIESYKQDSNPFISDPYNFVCEIYPKSWNENTNMYQYVRVLLTEWIERYKNNK